MMQNIFIKLSSKIINKFHIVEITKKPSKYYIHMSNTNIDGFFLFGSGGIINEKNIIEICEKQNKPDYETITRFIDEIYRV